MFQIVGIGTQLTEALAGLERTRESSRRSPRTRTRGAPAPSDRSRATCALSTSTFAYEAGKPVLHDISFESRPAP